MEVIAVKGWKIVVLHCEPRLMVRIVAKSVAMNLFGTGYGWFLARKPRRRTRRSCVACRKKRSPLGERWVHRGQRPDGPQDGALARPHHLQPVLHVPEDLPGGHTAGQALCLHGGPRGSRRGLLCQRALPDAQEQLAVPCRPGCGAFHVAVKTGGYGLQIFCCKGISLEILHQLATDLNFEYIVYFVNDTDYGTYSNGAWTGMVGDVVSGAADMIVGAFSMTSGRMRAISFTEPFYQNEFSMISGEDGRSPSMWAFLSPFSAQVWTCILLSSIVAGVATSVLEWFSPFGLNPRGRRRQKQYSLGSGLLMVWVLVTGHTINVKAPKSWPSKVIQNVWAGLAIFIMTSYTANLAAYLAGQSAVISVKSIFDSKLLQKRVSVIKSSAVEAFLAKVNPDLFRSIQNNDANCTEDAILALQAHETDIYFDDASLLEFAVSRLDKDCKVRFVGKGFGTDGYAIGLSKHSWMRIPMSNHILSYVESGFVQDLSRKYLSRSHCEYFLTGSAVQYGLEHTGGLFFILLSAMFVSVFFLFLEHLAYRFLVPWLRSRPEGSFWKTENLAFISQRVHRVVRSEKLYSQKQAAQR
ncbi:glutamate receptor ionotropic, NMDA 3A-like [Pomacea canaliculata]|uniref:glutamate receptor ionotropic, NMDA 3A-like n=1 Tax=Pomacea canaliculata TaxID=400727 RepID=UPI000D7371AB|nr:glutamate receptor ionotropic, NMDA 3A-like [Pomacea canaliculata]